MTNVYSNIYWQSEFTITQADLDRLEDYITETGQAHDLTVLVKRIIRGRLRYGDESSPAALGIQTAFESGSVRLWDPAGQWQIGDHVIIWTWSYIRRVNEVKIGEIVDQNSQYVFIMVEDRRDQKRQFERAESGSGNAKKWRCKVEEEVEKLRRSQDIDEWIELIALEHSDRVASQLLDALQADERFVRLSGRWFLRRLAVLPSTTQLHALAWVMLNLAEPQPTEALLPLIPSPISPGDPGLFGLYLALREQPHLFANADPGQRPRWVLAGPPPGPVKAGYAAFDPETYHILCEPEEPITAAVAARLWQLELFRVICAPQK